MKSKILITGVILCAITTTGAHAVTKCVALDGNGNYCRGGSVGDNGDIDWYSTCFSTATSDEAGTQIRGIGVCSSSEGYRGYDREPEITLSGISLEDNKNCWCRIISPAVSEWVFHSEFASSMFCTQGCARACLEDVQQGTGTGIHLALFGSLSD